MCGGGGGGGRGGRGAFKNFPPDLSLGGVGFSWLIFVPLSVDATLVFRKWWGASLKKLLIQEGL